MPFKKVSREKIEAIKELRASGMSHDHIASTLGVSKNTAIKYSRDIGVPTTSEEIKNSIEGDTMGKLKLDLNKVVSKAAEEAVENVIEKRLEPDENSIVIDDEPPDGVEAFFGDNLSMPSIIKIYKVISGSVRFLAEVEAELFQTWDDFESGFRRYVIDRTSESRSTWGDGTYQIRYRDKVKRIELGGIAMPEKNPAVKSSNAVDEFERIGNILKLTKEIMPKGNNSEESTYKILYEHQKTEIALLREELKSLREKDVQDDIHKALELARLVKGGKEGLLDKAIDVMSPHIPQVLNTFAAVAGLGVRKLRGLPMNPQQPKKEPAPSLPKSEPPQQPDIATDFKSLFDELYGYIASNDTSRFPRIAEVITELFGTSAVDGIASGDVTPGIIANTLNAHGGEKFKDSIFLPQMNRYVEGFCSWIKTIRKPEPLTPEATPQPESEPVNESAMVYGRCDRCALEYEFVDRKSFEDDTKVCDNIIEGKPCPGKIILVEDEKGPLH